MVWEVRAQIGEPGTNLAIMQGCCCNVDTSTCPNHSNIDAFAVEFIYYGQRAVVLSTKSHIKMPIKREIYFFRNLELAVRKWGERHPLLDTILLKKEGNEFRKFTRDEMDDVFDIQDMIHLEISGI